MLRSAELDFAEDSEPNNCMAAGNSILPLEAA